MPRFAYPAQFSAEACDLAGTFFPFLATLINKVGNNLLPQLLEDSKPLWMGAIKLQK